jgi:hypothetical protein
LEIRERFGNHPTAAGRLDGGPAVPRLLSEQEGSWGVESIAVRIASTVEQASSLFFYARYEVPLELLKDRLEALSYLPERQNGSCRYVCHSEIKRNTATWPSGGLRWRISRAVTF